MHIETGAARAMENRLFRSMFEERKRVFVDLLRSLAEVASGRIRAAPSDKGLIGASAAAL